MSGTQPRPDPSKNLGKQYRLGAGRAATAPYGSPLSWGCRPPGGGLGPASPPGPPPPLAQTPSGLERRVLRNSPGGNPGIIGKNRAARPPCSSLSRHHRNPARAGAARGGRVGLASGSGHGFSSGTHRPGKHLYERPHPGMSRREIQAKFDGNRGPSPKSSPFWPRR